MAEINKLSVGKVRNLLGEMVAILAAALAHHIAEQDAALRRIYHVFEGGTEKTEGRVRVARYMLAVCRHCSAPSFRGVQLPSHYSTLRSF